MKYLAAPFFCLALAGVVAGIPSPLGCGGPAIEEGMTALPDMTLVTTYSCDLPNKSPPQCREFSEISAAQPVSGLESLCESTLTPGPCTRASSYGGCRTKNATYTFTTWFYAGGNMFTSAAQVQTYCGTAYVPPS